MQTAHAAASIEKAEAMHKFTVSITREIEADTAEEAALLMYQELSTGPIPDRYSVTDETKAITEVKLDRHKADEFASIDHTADPGNW
ncbi:hypothetical protein ABIA10_000856 [Rhizobium leguminosarum]